MNDVVEKIEQMPVVQESQESQMVTMIERLAMNPDVDVDKLERMFALQETMLNRQSEQDFNKAMASAQSEMGRVSADATNPQTRSRYASYAALDKALRPIYSAHGFALSFGTDDSPKPDCVRVVCHVTHEAGHSRLHHIDMDASGKGAKGGDVMTKTHATGSAASYGMRYLLKLIFNVAIGEDDDDGNGAGAPIEYITEDQVLQLHAKATENEVMDGFMKWLKSLKIDGIEGIHAENFDIAMRRLDSAIRAKKK